MKRLLLSASLVAIAGPAWGQAHVLHKEFIHCPGAHDGDVILAIACHTRDSDKVVAVGQAIGKSRVNKLTSPVTVLKPSEIQNRNQGVVADLLRTIPGLAVSQNGGAGSLTQIRLRGSEANHIVVIIDGVGVANPSDGAFDFGGLRTEDILKIEVLRGEQSALYGSDAIGGVINIITRTGSDKRSWRLSTEAGSRDTFEGQISAVFPILVKDASLSINGNAFTTEGFDISGLGGERDGAKSRSVNIGINNIELGYRTTLNGKFSSTIRETEFDSDGDFNGRLDNTNDTTEVKTETVRIDAQFELGEFEHIITGHWTETDTDTVGGFSSRSIGTRQVVNWAAKREFADSHSFTFLGEVEQETYEIEPNFTEPGAEPENTAYGIAGDYRFNKNDITLTPSPRHEFQHL